jgi:charged multivesicular body protein 6
MGNLFSKKNNKQSNNVSQQDLAVLQLKQLRDKMKIAQKKVILQMEKDREVARRLIQEDKKDRALLLLKRKKRMEKSVTDIDNKLEILEKMVSDIEFSQIELRLIEGLKTGNEALKHLNSLISVESIESILGETREADQKQKEISDLLMGGKDWSTEDEDDLQRELNELIEVREEETVVKLPPVPTEELPEEETENREPIDEVERSVKQKKRRQKELPLPAS